MKVITEQQLQNIHNDKKVVVALFTQEHCFPCGCMKTAMGKVEESLKRPDVLEFVELPTEQNEKLSEALTIEYSPTMIIFHEGNELARTERAITVKEIKNAIANTIAENKINF